MSASPPTPLPGDKTGSAWFSISLRLVIPAVLTIILFTIAIFFIILPGFEDQVLERKRETSQGLTQMAWNTLEHYHTLEEQGVVSRSQAQELAKAQLRAQRFGPGGKDYFWINDLAPRMVMHPYRQDLEGADVSGFSDPSGKRVFQDVVATVKKNGAGYVDYLWQWQDDPSHIVPKVSYVKLFKPWGWVVGTGIYLEDARAEIQGMTSRLTTIALIILGVVALLVFFMVQEGLRSERRRRQAEYGLRHSQGMLELVMDNIPQLIFWKDKDGVYLGCNRGFAAEAGLDDPAEIVGLSDRQVPWDQEHAAEQRQREREVMASGAAELHGEERHGQAQGGSRWMDVSRIPLREPGGEVRGILCTQEDITQRKEMEHLMRLQDKMASLGRIAAGMAHEIRNPLSGFNMYLSALEGLEPGDPRRGEILGKLKAASSKIETVIKQVLDFARPGAPRLAWGQVNRVIMEVVELSSVTLRKAGVSLDTRLEKNLPLCFVDAQLLEQVLLNLVTNAVQALKDWPKDKRIRLSSALDKERIIIMVEDSGPGVPEEVAERIFDPFFTERKDGLGIGLSLCHRIISDHGGSLSVRRGAWGGALFTIVIPVDVYYGYDSHG
ncbi:MAG: cache domain-containing protein [Desulfarculaceae bacterium]|nr:cache domain-containing protein [Desulfarculaceae bacterium]